jgi:hypothetical protein
MMIVISQGVCVSGIEMDFPIKSLSKTGATVPTNVGGIYLPIGIRL